MEKKLSKKEVERETIINCYTKVFKGEADRYYFAHLDRAVDAHLQSGLFTHEEMEKILLKAHEKAGNPYG